MSVFRRSSTEMKRWARATLRSMGPSPELMADLVSIRNDVDATARRVEQLAHEVASLADALRPVQDDQTYISVSNLGGTVVGVSERVHAHEQELREIQLKLERFGGSVLDEMAVDRRLRNIENRLIGLPEDLREGELRQSGDGIYS